MKVQIARLLGCFIGTICPYSVLLVAAADERKKDLELLEAAAPDAGGRGAPRALVPKAADADDEDEGDESSSDSDDDDEVGLALVPAWWSMHGRPQACP